MKLTKKSLDRVQIKDTQIDVIMPEKVLNQIKYLCSKIHAVEWSGILFYTIDGTIKDPKNLKLTLQTILPMHKGTGTYTEYAFDDRVVDFMMENPEAMTWKMAHIHSHNNMAVFFSGTDMSELEDNAPNHNFYLSLIVNNRMDFCAKVCFIATTTENREVSFFAKDENGENYVYKRDNVNSNVEELVIYDCNIHTPQLESLEESFIGQVDGIIKAAEKPKTYFKSTTVTKSSGIPKKPYRFIGTDNKSRIVTPAKSWEAKSFHEREAEEEIIENFTKYVFNYGNEVNEDDDLQDILDQYETYAMQPDHVVSSILEKFPSLYAKFYEKNPECETDAFFIDVVNSVIEEIKAERNLLSFNETYAKDVLTGTVEALQRMLNNFIKTSENG